MPADGDQNSHSTKKRADNHIFITFSLKKSQWMTMMLKSHCHFRVAKMVHTHTYMQKRGRDKSTKASQCKLPLVTLSNLLVWKFLSKFVKWLAIHYQIIKAQFWWIV